MKWDWCFLELGKRSNTLNLGFKDYLNADTI
jgi:hypothetical protein